MACPSDRCGSCPEVMWRATPYGVVRYCDVNKEALAVVEEGDAGARPALARCGACLANGWKDAEEVADAAL